MKMGYDLYYIDASDLLILLQYVKRKHLKIFHLRKKEEYYCFYTSSFQRYQWNDCEIPMEYIKTIGFFKYLLFLKGIQSLIVITGFIIGLFCFTHMIFSIEINGTLPALNQKINHYLKDSHITLYTKKKSYEQLNDILSQMKNIYKKEVEYLNVDQRGSVFFIEYTKKQKQEQKKDDFRNIYALKDGMIESFDVDSGMIKVKRLDYVKKGDLLIENTLVSTDEKTKIIPVKGHVYAYTFNQYQASIKNNNQDQSDAFYQLLLMIRAKIPADAKISKENVLQMKKTRSTITLTMHYTLLEDIAMKKEN